MAQERDRAWGFSSASDIAANLQRVKERIAAASIRVGRDPDEVTVVAVSKTRPVAEILQAYDAGTRHLGENRIEEAEDKIAALRRLRPAAPPIWHMVGHVQSRKARRVVELCDLVHSVDSVHLAQRLDHFAEEMGRSLPILLEINISGEGSKYGFPGQDERQRASLSGLISPLANLVHVQVQGLMTMAPIVSAPELARPVFRRLRALCETLREQLPFSTWSELSMGMTDDFEVAIEEGATLVRIGRAIFGPSTY